jgi:hypothetical protein
MSLSAPQRSASTFESGLKLRESHRHSLARYATINSLAWVALQARQRTRILSCSMGHLRHVQTNIWRSPEQPAWDGRGWRCYLRHGHVLHGLEHQRPRIDLRMCLGLGSFTHTYTHDSAITPQRGRGREGECKGYGIGVPFTKREGYGCGMSLPWPSGGT